MTLWKDTVHFLILIRLCYSSFSSFRRTEAVELFSELNPEDHQMPRLSCHSVCSGLLAVQAHHSDLSQWRTALSSVGPLPAAFISEQLKVHLKASKSEENRLHHHPSRPECLLYALTDQQVWSGQRTGGEWLGVFCFSPLDKSSSIWLLATTIAASAYKWRTNIASSRMKTFYASLCFQRKAFSWLFLTTPTRERYLLPPWESIF